MMPVRMLSKSWAIRPAITAASASRWSSRSGSITGPIERGQRRATVRRSCRRGRGRPGRRRSTAGRRRSAHSTARRAAREQHRGVDAAGGVGGGDEHGRLAGAEARISVGQLGRQHGVRDEAGGGDPDDGGAGVGGPDEPRGAATRTPAPSRPGGRRRRRARRRPATSSASMPGRRGGRGWSWGKSLDRVITAGAKPAIQQVSRTAVCGVNRIGLPGSEWSQGL